MSQRLPRGTLRQIAPAAPVTDLRAARFAALSEEESEARAAIAATLATSDAALVDELARLRSEIREGWKSAASAFLQIGRALCRIEAMLSRTDFHRLISDKQYLPFGRASAVKMMSVARAVDGGRIEPHHLPPYSVAYELVTLPDPLLRLASAQGLIRPDVKRDEIAAFKLAQRPAEPEQVDPEALHRERGNLRARRARLETELAAIDRRLRTIADLLHED